MPIMHESDTAHLYMIICEVNALHRLVLFQRICNFYGLIVACIRATQLENIERIQMEA